MDGTVQISEVLLYIKVDKTAKYIKVEALLRPSWLYIVESCFMGYYYLNMNRLSKMPKRKNEGIWAMVGEYVRGFFLQGRSSFLVNFANL